MTCNDGNSAAVGWSSSLGPLRFRSKSIHQQTGTMQSQQTQNKLETASYKRCSICKLLMEGSGENKLHQMEWQSVQTCYVI
jgi:hypothetical protein